MLADSIAKLIEEMLDEGGGSLELKRNEMATRLGCVPSQISYVITSRFTPERGYIIESRRGGGGCIRIVRKQMHGSEYLMHFFHAIGDMLDERDAAALLRNLRDNGIIDDTVAGVMAAAISERALARVEPRGRSSVRADIMRHILLGLLR